MPVAFFAVVMGIAGVALAWARAERVLGLPLNVSGPLIVLAACVFAALLLAYAAKAWRHGAQVAAEFRHPVRSNFFPAISISLLLFSVAAIGPAPAVAHVLWLAGTGLHLVFTVLAINRWLDDPAIELAHLSPAWFIPVVGNVLVPLAGVKLYPAEISWFFFSIGMLFWLVLLVLVLNRLFFHAPLPQRLRATMSILIAPPAVGTLAWLALTGQVGPVVHALYSVALFFTLLVAANTARLLGNRFYLSAWAFSFPLAAVSIASLALSQHTGSRGYALIGMLLLSAATLVVAGLLLRTGLAIARHEICVPE